MKYEIKGTYKYILGVLALVLILTTGIYFYMSRANQGSAVGGIFIMLSSLILFGTALVTFLYIVGSFRKELYEDRGYLTFTLPLTGNQILGSKLMVALLWFLTLGIVIGVYNMIMVLSFSPVEVNLSEAFSVMTQVISIKGILVVALTAIFSIVNMLVLIYFSMALSRVTFRNKRIGSLWFIVFLILSAFLAYGQFAIAEFLPYYFELNTMNVGTMDMLDYQFNLEINNGVVNFNNGVPMNTNVGMTTFNIASAIYSIGTTIALFLGTGYLIEKKINL